MELRLLEFAEYAAITDQGKLVIAGIFDTLRPQLARELTEGEVPQIPLPPCYLVWIVSASLADGLAHTAELAVRNEDGREVHRFVLGTLDFILNPTGHHMRHQGRVTIEHMPLPGPGDYSFELHVSGQFLGSAPLVVDSPTVAEP